MAKFCCAEFERDATPEQPKYAGNYVSPPQFDWYAGGTIGGKYYEPGWSILGCCKSCSVVGDMRFCPYCGTKLDPPA